MLPGTKVSRVAWYTKYITGGEGLQRQIEHNDEEDIQGQIMALVFFQLKFLFKIVVPSSFFLKVGRDSLDKHSDEHNCERKYGSYETFKNNFFAKNVASSKRVRVKGS